jgi:hypothetical protein
MDWIQAQSKARGGSVVRRGAWPATKVVSDAQGTLSVTDERGFGAPYYPTAEDREASDWQESTAEELAEAQEKAREEQAAKDKEAQDKAKANQEAASKMSEDRAAGERASEPEEAEVEGSENRGSRKKR